MKQMIEIEVPDGKKAIWKEGKIVFKDIKPQLPKTWKEFCDQNALKLDEYFIDNASYMIGVNVDERNETSDRNVLPSKQAAEQHLALMQLHQLRDCYRQGWEPNWIENTSKWVIYKEKNCLVVVSAVFYSKFLSFPTRELAEEFLNNFRGLIEQAGDLI